MTGFLPGSVPFHPFSICCCPHHLKIQFQSAHISSEGGPSPLRGLPVHLGCVLCPCSLSPGLGLHRWLCVCVCGYHTPELYACSLPFTVTTSPLGLVLPRQLHGFCHYTLSCSQYLRTRYCLTPPCLKHALPSPRCVCPLFLLLQPPVHLVNNSSSQ